MMLRGAVAICALTLGGSALAAEPDSGGYLTFQVENDMFGNGADRHYTNGVGLSYATPPGRNRWVADLAHALRLLPRHQELETRVTLSLGQAIYTPSDITRIVPDPADRPYAGWLFASAGLVATPVEPPAPTGRLFQRGLHKIEFNVGVVGPASLAEQSQKNVHEWVGAQRPRGWDSQLKNELTLLVSYQFQHRFGLDTGYFELDATPHVGAAAGNVFTYGQAGLTLRVGHAMLSDFGPPRIRPAAPGSAFFEDAENTLGWYVFAGVEGRAVARNIFLDGNTFVDGPSVRKRRLVGDAQFGAAVTYGALRLSYANVFRTREFFGQKAQDEFGVITASVRL